MRKILEKHGQGRREPHEALAPKPDRAPRLTKLDSFRDAVAGLLERYREITAQRVFEELRTLGYEGGYTQVKQYVHKTRPRPPITPSLVTPEYGPGEMAESDWSPYTIDFTSGQRATVQAFAYVACFSHRKSFRFYERSDFFALLDGHVATFEHFQGVLSVCKYDCQKAVVLGWEGRQPIYNPRFLAFCAHYEFRPQACRPGHPNDKPHVERAFWELERSFLNGRSFHDLSDLRAQLAQWQAAVCDTRPHKKLKRSSLDLFTEEAPGLVPLPRHPYDTARVVYRVCSIDGFVAWNGNRYAVPYEHVTDILPVRITQHELFVYAPDLVLVARHALAPRGAAVDVDPQGIPPPWNRHGADLDQLRCAFDQMGEDAAQFFAALSAALPRHAGHHARHILVLRERYSTQDLCAALRHARSFGALDHHAVERILAARTTPRSLAEYVTEDTAHRLDQILGASTTRPRDLQEYDQLPLASSTTNKEDSCPQSDPPTPDPTTSPSDSDDTSNS